MSILSQLLPCVLIDYETRSQVEIKVHGVARYVESPTTQVIGVAATLMWPGGENTLTFDYDDDVEAKATELRETARDIERQHGPLVWVAHGADHFDRLTHDNTPFIGGTRSMAAMLGEDITPDTGMWVDSQTLCRMHGLPSRLANACRFLNTPTQKDPNGEKLIRKFSRPGFAEMTPGDLAEWRKYVLDDVQGVREILARLPDMDDLDGYMDDAIVHRRINDRGVRLDMALVERACATADVIRAAANKACDELTGGAVERTSQIKRLKEWLGAKLTDTAVPWMDLTKGGKSLDKAHASQVLLSIEEALEHVDANSDEESNLLDARDAIDLLRVMNKAALSKFPAMRDRVSAD